EVGTPPRALAICQDRELELCASVGAVVQPGRGADELLVDPLDVTNRRIRARKQVWRTCIVMSLEHVVILIALHRNPAGIADQAANLPLLETVGRARSRDDV